MYCDSAIINGETSQSFTPTASGDYAVIVSKDGCSDTSVCYTVNTVGIVENTFGSSLKVYPIPTDGVVVIDLGASYSDVTVIVRNAVGQTVSTKKYTSSQKLQLDIEGSEGIYFIEVQSAEGRAASIRVMKQE